MSMIPVKGKMNIKKVLTPKQFQKGSYKTSFYRTYKQAVMLLYQLSDSQKNLLLYLIDVMDKENEVFIVSEFFDKMNKVLLTEGKLKEPYKTNTCYKNLYRLKELDIVQRMGQSHYRVSPVLFFKSNEQRRVIAIRAYIEFNPNEITFSSDRTYE